MSLDFTGLKVLIFNCSLSYMLVMIISSESHRKNLHQYWWENGADRNLKSKFLVDKERFSRFVQFTRLYLILFVRYCIINTENQNGQEYQGDITLKSCDLKTIIFLIGK